MLMEISLLPQIIPVLQGLKDLPGLCYAFTFLGYTAFLGVGDDIPLLSLSAVLHQEFDLSLVNYSLGLSLFLRHSSEFVSLRYRSLHDVARLNHTLLKDM